MHLLQTQCRSMKCMHDMADIDFSDRYNPFNSSCKPYQLSTHFPLPHP